MEEARIFLIVYFAALFGVLPPGLVNMTVAKTCIERGKKNGMLVAIGASIVILIQAFVAVLLAKYIFDHPFVQRVMLRAALVIFIILGVYFFIQAKNKKGAPSHSKKKNKNSLYKGMLIAALNIFPIPYFCAIAGGFNVGVGVSYNWFKIIAFAAAASLGSFTSLYLYVLSFIKIESKAEKFAKYSNYFMAGLMLILVIVTIFRIYNS
ncbi:LysE family translocator [Zunongwangia sp. HGR-M22]|uniref:LysE family translocator n=1 Tax=Zunongwangia sp. HGR-M22 TaxID=3015168 RepID=UPI0022DD4971|nr:LysE family transporter [Zunongwangia sp. HGR-M22]WBL25964.1 LysE family transporter [Zunongwangia sp. HGR-M22]